MPGSQQPKKRGQEDNHKENEEKDEQEDIVVCDNVHKTYLLGVEGVPALRGVSLRIKKGEFIIVFGKSGGGKTSLLNIIGTIDHPTKGDLHLCGKRVHSKTTDEEFASIRLTRIGFVFQTFNLISTMTAVQNVALPMVLAGQLSRSEINARAIELLERVGMGDRLSHLPSQLSGGEQQRVTIARSVANSPVMLLLDEPTGDLDSKNSHLVMKLLVDLNRKEKITCIMVTHAQRLKDFAHRVVHMMDGKVHRLEAITQAARDACDADLERDLVDAARKEYKAVVKQETRDASNYPFLAPR